MQGFREATATRLFRVIRTREKFESRQTLHGWNPTHQELRGLTRRNSDGVSPSEITGHFFRNGNKAHQWTATSLNSTTRDGSLKKISDQDQCIVTFFIFWSLVLALRLYDPERDQPLVKNITISLEALRTAPPLRLHRLHKDCMHLTPGTPKISNKYGCCTCEK
ncbi:predicted protein [Plenodomus lingam JN3]|uniref:Predicted protein n=1 Tax=Leptosphaeria maculans (strain JN3 / isolate v23.1.3 / race Av1-4-5-6-7-8) TaxID=985895 RepID=E5ABT8_LEPMJ|nr:predicted protein [Plenodomus lingam JN3]CBY01129.1 predicted protein [Plenodomus lingam JN3]